MKTPLILCSLAFVVFFSSMRLSRTQAVAQTVNDQPTVVAAVAPMYPPIARSAHTTGDVVVEVKINSRGDVESSRVLSGHPLLQNVGKEIAKKWKFVSTTEKRSRVVQLTFTFGRVESGKSVPEFTTTFLPPYNVELIWNSTAY